MPLRRITFGDISPTGWPPSSSPAWYPAIEQVFGALSSVYWSSTPVAVQGSARFAFFGNGFVDACVDIGTCSGDVRAVRNAP